MIQDSGKRREFASGAVRDIDEGKGRCDLLPLREVGEALDCHAFNAMVKFLETGNMGVLEEIIFNTVTTMFKDKYTAMLEVAMHYAEGIQKYGERNWEKGISCHCYVDSYVRHTLKWLRGDTDERHDRAALWNLLGLKWTIRHKPECNDLPYNTENNNSTTITYKEELGDIYDI